MIINFYSNFGSKPITASSSRSDISVYLKPLFGNRQAGGGGQVFHTESLGRIIWDEQGGMGSGWSSGNLTHRSIGHLVRFYSTSFVFLKDGCENAFHLVRNPHTVLEGS